MSLRFARSNDLIPVLDALSDGILKVDSQWIVQYLNPAAARMLNVDRKDAIGRTIWEIAAEFPRDFVEKAGDTEQPVTFCEYQRDGEWKRVDITRLDQGASVIQIRSRTPLDDLTARLDREIAKRKSAENALEANQAFLQAVLDHIGVGIVACDETGTLKLFNNATRAFHGLPESPTPPEDWATRYDLYYPDGTTRLRKEDVPLYRAFSGESVKNAEMVIAPAHGPRRTILASGRALIGRDGRKLGAVVAMHDVTHRRLSGARIRQALRQFRALFNDAPIAYHEVDVHGIIRRVNRAECRLLGYAREDIVGRPVWAFVSAGEQERVRTLVFEKLAGRLPLERVEREYTSASGKRLVLDVHENAILDSTGAITGIRTAMLDITEQKQREQEAQVLAQERAAREQAEATSAEIKSILERIGDAYIAFDADWRYTYVNRRAAELALKPASELLGRCVWDEFPQAVHTSFYVELQRAMREQIPVEFENYYEPLGKYFENSVYPSPSGVGVFYRDISERVRAQRALEKGTRELALKNAELETFASVASHDLQEPLRMISGYASLLKRRYGDVLDGDATDFLAFMTQGVDRMQRLVKDLLALCRLDESSPASLSEVDMSDILNVVVSTLELTIDDTGATISRGDLPVVKFNQTQLLQLVQNLVGNALKYRSAAPPEINITAEREHGAWRIAVRDNGEGFDMQYASQIFQPFKRLSSGDDRGTGIGLAICRKIVEGRGGRIWVESAPGKGSTFFFTIPDANPTDDK